MRTKKRRLWILLFVGVTLLLGTLATGWNLVLVKEYQYFVTLGRYLSLPNDLKLPTSFPLLKMLWGTLGFIAALALTILLFIKLLSEMRLNQLQSEFLATVSHELKTPIASLELTSSLLRTDQLSPTEISELWISHQSELKRLREEVETLLEAARWQSKPSLTEKRPINLEEWISRSYERWRAFLGPEAALMRKGDLLPIHALLDLRSLDLIFDTLLSNAKKFSRGTPQVTLTTRILHPSGHLKSARWQVQLEDQGWGFDPNDKKKIFHRFFRSRTKASYAIPGTGLGLYLAHSASRAMKLDLRGESEGPGKGARFILEGSEYLK